jgi:LCP family protein required for cell wall assembly
MDRNNDPGERRLSRREIYQDELRNPWPRRIAMFLGGFFLVLVIAVVGFAGASMITKRSPFDMVAGMFVPSPQQVFGKDRIRVLAVGLDYDYNDKDEEYSKSARTDTIITASLNFPTPVNPKPSVGVVSVPRDMLITYPNGHHDKINGAYTDGGITKSEAVIADFLGIPGFDRYVTLRINSSKALISAIGGIDVVPDETMDYDDSWGHLHIHFKEGKKYHMNGEQAISYARFRHDACGDPCRIKRQQQVMRIALAKLKNDKFNDLVHIQALIDVFRKNVDTNFTPQELLSVARAFQTVDLADVAMTQVPFTGDEDLACCGNVILADDAAKKKIVGKIFLDPILPAVDPSDVAAIPPGKVKVEVANGSGIAGLATRMAADLKKRGFVVVAVTNAEDFGHETTEIQTHSATLPLAGAKVKAELALPSAVVSPNPSPAPESATSDVTIVVGRDYNAAQLQATAATPK